jgi:exosortase C (VPDSG-CTERM-specific)
MSHRPDLTAEAPPEKTLHQEATTDWVRPWAISCGFLVFAFALPLYHWVKFGIESSVFSHILLIPAVSGYLAWTNKSPLRAPNDRARPFLALSLAALAAALLAAYFAITAGGRSLVIQDTLAFQIGAFVAAFAAVCAWKMPRSVLRDYLFPIGFLVLMVPFPTFLHRALETALQHGSAEAAYAMLRVVGTPVLRDDLVFHIPGISLEVAPQCSGIRSTLALFVTSIVAGYLFLRSPWKRVLLTGFVIPLAILRNGFRVFTIAELCVHYGSDMVHTPIHHQGGPIFFALSLIPFGALLWWLRRSERTL